MLQIMGTSKEYKILKKDFPRFLRVLYVHSKNDTIKQLTQKFKGEAEKDRIIKKYTKKTGRPYLLGELDEMVREYLVSLWVREEEL